MNLSPKEIQTHTHREHNCGCQGKGGLWELWSGTLGLADANCYI